MIVIFGLIVVGAIVAVGIYALIKLKKRIQLMNDVADDLLKDECCCDDHECCGGENEDCCGGDRCKK
jgi:hypothetical protein